jgi:hypothetical protein
MLGIKCSEPHDSCRVDKDYLGKASIPFPAEWR